LAKAHSALLEQQIFCPKRFEYFFTENNLVVVK
jgi:hypothetical protein